MNKPYKIKYNHQWGLPICLSIVGLKIGYLGSKSQTNGIAKERALRNNGG